MPVKFPLGQWQDVDDVGPPGQRLRRLRQYRYGVQFPERGWQAGRVTISERIEAKALAAAQLCIEAGADETLIPRWIEEGRRRAENARRMPHSGRPRRRRS